MGCVSHLSKPDRFKQINCIVKQKCLAYYFIHFVVSRLPLIQTIPRVSQLRDREAHAQTGGRRVDVCHVRLGDQAEDEAVGARGVCARRDLRIHVRIVQQVLPKQKLLQGSQVKKVSCQKCVKLLNNWLNCHGSIDDRQTSLSFCFISIHLVDFSTTFNFTLFLFCQIYRK